MRVVRATDGAARRARATNGREVIRGIDQEPGCALAQVACRIRLVDLIAGSEQQTAAFVRDLAPRMGDDLVDHLLPDPHAAHLATHSTIMAVPMPPPMQSEAAPRPPPRARSAWTSVVNTRAPLAPIGCPRATAPPWTLTLAGSSFSSRTTASDCAANASFNS